MVSNRDNLEPIDPSTARELFLDHKATDCTKATVRNHRYRTKYLIKWCAQEGIENLNELTGRDIQRFRLWRKNEFDLQATTLRNQMSTLRVFLKWAGSIEAVPEDLYNKVMVPRIGREERRRDETLYTETAQELIDYLARYYYASIQHIVIATLWETGMRIGAAVSLDLCDVDIDKEALRLVHRPTQGTTLKNGQSGERPVAIRPTLVELLEEHIDQFRYDVIDEYDREPLFTTKTGRMQRATLRRLVYQTTAPCFRGAPCPDCTGDSEQKCPEAVSPHAIRRGAITHFLTNDVPIEIVGDRVNVSRDVLEHHYDKRSEVVKLEQRRSYLDNL